MPGHLILVRGGHADMVTMAHIGDFIKCGHRVTGVTPSPIFRASDVPIGDDGGLLVNDALQCVAHPEIFGGGDCITLASCPLARVGVYAVGQNPILFHDLLAALDGGPMESFTATGPFLIILKMGDDTGTTQKRGIVLRGRWVFRLKDTIDRRFMKRYQLSGELEEDNDIPAQ